MPTPAAGAGANPAWGVDGFGYDVAPERAGANQPNPTLIAGRSLGFEAPGALAPTPAALVQILDLGNITLSTSGATTTVTNALPAGALIWAVLGTIKLPITGLTSLQVGDGTTANRFGVISTFSAGTGLRLLDHWASGKVAQTSVANLVLTGNATPTGGGLHLLLVVVQFTAPTS